jgi:hypothetical protein
MHTLAHSFIHTYIHTYTHAYRDASCMINGIVISSSSSPHEHDSHQDETTDSHMTECLRHVSSSLSPSLQRLHARNRSEKWSNSNNTSALMLQHALYAVHVVVLKGIFEALPSMPSMPSTSMPSTPSLLAGRVRAVGAQCAFVYGSVDRDLAHAMAVEGIMVGICMCLFMYACLYMRMCV